MTTSGDVGTTCGGAMETRGSAGAGWDHAAAIVGDAKFEKGATTAGGS